MSRFRLFSWNWGPIVVTVWFMISTLFYLVTDQSYLLISILIGFLYLLYCFYLDRKYLTKTQVIRGYTYKSHLENK